MSAYAGQPATAWLDEDGKHIWSQHTCTAGEVTTMLPWPMWHADLHWGLPVVEPSIACETCGYHGVAVPLVAARAVRSA